MQGTFSVVLDNEWPECPAIWVGMSWDQKNFMQENSGLIFRSLVSARKTGVDPQNSKCVINPLFLRKMRRNGFSIATPRSWDKCVF